MFTFTALQAFNNLIKHILVVSLFPFGIMMGMYTLSFYGMLLINMPDTVFSASILVLPQRVLWRTAFSY
jgi:hypothetical protein